MSDLFAMGQQGGSAQSAGPEKPLHAAATVAVAFGVNLTDAKGLANLDAKAYTDKKLVTWGSTEKDRRGFGQRKMAEAGNAYVEHFKNPYTSANSSSSSGGGDSGGSAATSSGSGAPVSSGGGGSSGGVGGGRVGLSNAIASLQGLPSMEQHFVANPMPQVHIDHTPSPAATPVIAQAASAADGPALG